MYYCKKCGAALTPEKRFCSQCGTPVEEIASTAQPTASQAETPAAATIAQPTASQAETPAAAATTQPTAPQAETPAAATAQPTTSQVETPAAATAQPTAPQVETPAAATTAQPAAPQAETPAAATAQPTTSQVETPAAATAQPTAPQVETPAAATTAQPAAPQVETPAAATTTQPTAPQAEAPAAAPTTQPTAPQADAPATASTTQPTAPQADAPATATTTQPTAPQQAAAPQNGTPVSPQSSATTQQQAAWQNPQQQGQKAANNINFSNGVQKLEESDSFMFRSLGLTLKTLMKKPVQLWGLSLLGVILQSLSNVLCAVPPILGMGVSSTLSAGMENVFLDAYHQKEINSKQIFSGFSSGKSFLRIAGGMLWRTLWLFLWALFALIPIVGWVIAPIMLVIKGISYSFTPYLLLRKKDISPLDALKRSMEMTKGYRGKIFLTYLICYAALLVVGLLLFLIAQIPVIGFIIVGIVGVVISVLCPLFFGVLRAAMFTEVVRLEKVTDIEL